MQQHSPAAASAPAADGAAPDAVPAAANGAHADHVHRHTDAHAADADHQHHLHANKVTSVSLRLSQPVDLQRCASACVKTPLADEPAACQICVHPFRLVRSPVAPSHACLRRIGSAPFNTHTREVLRGNMPEQKVRAASPLQGAPVGGGSVVGPATGRPQRVQDEGRARCGRQQSAASASGSRLLICLWCILSSVECLSTLCHYANIFCRGSHHSEQAAVQPIYLCQELPMLTDAG